MSNLAVPRKKSSGPAKNGKQKAVPVIDFPREGEIITTNHYTIRIGSETAPVEISIDAGPWQLCRHAVGYFWFGWIGHTKGSHSIVVRSKTAAGRVYKSSPRGCRAT